MKKEIIGSNGQATLYCGDCLEILPTLEKVDTMITDPPYGISFSSGYNSSHKGQQIANDQDTSVRDRVIELFPEITAAIFGSWKVTPPSIAKTALVYDKGGLFGMGDLSIPWKCSWEIIWICGKKWLGSRGEGVLRGHTVIPWETRGRFHVNEKPVTLCEALIRKTTSDTIVDPFMGSGTTGVACANLNRNFIGIELDPKHFETACKRVSFAYKQERLFLGPKQTKLVRDKFVFLKNNLEKK